MVNLDSSVLLKELPTDQLINIIGLGAVGSYTAEFLAKSGFNNLNLWDFDKVEASNISTQAYGVQHIGMSKEEALVDLLNYHLMPKEQYREFQANLPYVQAIEPVLRGKFNAGDPLEGIVIVVVDNVQTRIDILNSCFASVTVDFIICTSLPYMTGLSDLSVQLTCIDGTDSEGIMNQINRYETLKEQIEANEEYYKTVLESLKACRTQGLGILSAFSAVATITALFKYYERKEKNKLLNTLGEPEIKASNKPININIYELI